MMVAQKDERPGFVSVIIPCYNQAHFLDEAIGSALAQADVETEVMVVDDGSRDNTAEVTARYPQVRCLRQETQGLCAARNAGLAASHGEFLVFLDADDYLLPGALAASLVCLRARPECAFTYGHVKLIAADGAPLTPPRQTAIHKEHYLELLRGCYIWSPGVVIYRRSALLTAGPFQSFPGCEDYELNLRLARQFPLCCNDQVVLAYRKHTANMSSNYARMLCSSVAVLQAQSPHIAGNEHYQRAQREGLNEMRRGYGEPLVTQVRSQLQTGQWRSAARGLAALAQAHPRGAVKACLPEMVMARLPLAPGITEPQMQ